MTPYEEQVAEALGRRGWTQYEVAEILTVHAPRKRHVRVSESEVRMMVELRREGMSYRKVARKVGRPRETVMYRLKKEGL